MALKSALNTTTDGAVYGTSAIDGQTWNASQKGAS